MKTNIINSSIELQDRNAYPSVKLLTQFNSLEHSSYYT
jgi:hypothetical protein